MEAVDKTMQGVHVARKARGTCIRGLKDTIYRFITGKVEKDMDHCGIHERCTGPSN